MLQRLEVDGLSKLDQFWLHSATSQSLVRDSSISTDLKDVEDVCSMDRHPCKGGAVGSNLRSQSGFQSMLHRSDLALHRLDGSLNESI